MKLSEIKGEKAIEVFADLLEPASRILSDEEVLNSIKEKEPQVIIIKKMLKNHSKDVVEMMAILDDVPVEEYEVNFITLPAKLVELFNDEAINELFTSQSQNEVSDGSGSVMVNTEEKEN